MGQSNTGKWKDGVWRQQSEVGMETTYMIKDNSETCVCGADNAWCDTVCWKCKEDL